MSNPAEDAAEAFACGGEPQATRQPQERGRLVIEDSDGQRFEFDREDIASIAIMLAQECDDEDERAFVRSEWGPRL